MSELHETYSNDLETLLQKDSVVQSNIGASTRDLEPLNLREKKEPHKADKSASLDDFIRMVGKIVSIALKDKNVEFIFDEGKRLTADPETKLDYPYITYKVIERVPKGEIKPRERESIILEETDAKGDARQGRVYGQKFQCLVQFNIIASEYKLANEVMSTFEDLILSYTHYFKKNGVAELFFKKHLTDEDYDIYRQNVSIRNLRYYVEVEKLHVIFDSNIDGILV